MVPIYLLTHKKADVPLWSWAALRFKIPPPSGAISALEWQCVEMRMEGCCVYAELLDDTVVQEVGNRELVKEKKTQSPGRAGAFGCLRFVYAHRRDGAIRPLGGITTGECAPRAVWLRACRYRQRRTADAPPPVWRRGPDGPTAQKLRPDLIGNVETYSSFPFHLWPWPFVTEMIETGAMIRSPVAKKCRFWWIGAMRTPMEADDGEARRSFLAMR
jgi:hypothetical protein